MGAFPLFLISELPSGSNQNSLLNDSEHLNPG